MSSQLVKHPLSCSWLITGDLMLLNQPLEKLQRQIALKLQRKRDSCSFLQSSDKIYLLPFPSNINLLISNSHPTVISLQWFLYNTAEEFFREFNHISVICICTVELAWGELRIVGLIDALVPEVLADLEYLWDSADEQPLEEELRSYSHEKGHFVVVMVSNKGFLSKNTGTAIAPPQEGDSVGV